MGRKYALVAIAGILWSSVLMAAPRELERAEGSKNAEVKEGEPTRVHGDGALVGESSSETNTEEGVGDVDREANSRKNRARRRHPAIVNAERIMGSARSDGSEDVREAAAAGGSRPGGALETRARIRRELQRRFDRASENVEMLERQLREAVGDHSPTAVRLKAEKGRMRRLARLIESMDRHRYPAETPEKKEPSR